MESPICPPSPPPPLPSPSPLPPLSPSPRWFPEVQNIFYQGNKRKVIPLGQLEEFFASAAVLMTNQLRELAIDSITDYHRVFCPPKVRERPCK